MMDYANHLLPMLYTPLSRETNENENLMHGKSKVPKHSNLNFRKRISSRKLRLIH
jgi:hypothetical protein